MSLFVPKEVGEFFKRAQDSLAVLDATVTEFRGAAFELRGLAASVNHEVGEWRKLRLAVQGAISQATDHRG